MVFEEAIRETIRVKVAQSSKQCLEESRCIDLSWAFIKQCMVLACVVYDIVLFDTFTNRGRFRSDRISAHKLTRLYTYKERAVIKTKETKALVEGSKDSGVKDRSETDEPLPCQVAISESNVVSDFEGLPVFVWAEEGLDETGVDEAEED